jgi:hypothetical protein
MKIVEKEEIKRIIKPVYDVGDIVCVQIDKYNERWGIITHISKNETYNVTIFGKRKENLTQISYTNINPYEDVYETKMKRLRTKDPDIERQKYLSEKFKQKG